MNTPQITTRLANRLAALALSSVFTFALLLSVGGLATGYAPDTQLAQTSSTQHA